MVRLVAVVLFVGSLSACHPSGGTPKLAIVLGDHGLEFSRNRIPAGRYVVSFADHRSHPPADQHVVLTLGQADSGLRLEPGEHDVGTLLPNDVPSVLLNQPVHRVNYKDSLTIEASPGFPKKLNITLEDNGPKFSPTRLAAGRYLVTFVDHRSEGPRGQKVQLQFGPSGPFIALLTVSLGSHVVGLLVANDIPWLVIDGVRQYIDSRDAPTIVTSRDFPTPAT